MALISEGYRALNAALHEASSSFGASGGRRAAKVLSAFNRHGCATALDYGCGKGALKRALDIPLAEYDPAVPERAAEPVEADLVVCSDVLEHIEPECLDAVLDDLKRLTRKVGYFVIATRPAKKYLPDGRNAHLIVQPKEWWMRKLRERWAVEVMADDGLELIVEVTPCR